MKALNEQHYQLSRHLWIINYDTLIHTWATDAAPAIADKLFDGRHLIDTGPLVTRFCEAMRSPCDYGHLEQVYDSYMRETETPAQQFSVDRILGILLQRHMIRTSGFSAEPVPLARFSPATFDECTFMTPDMLTFIDEQRLWERTPYVVLNPRAGTNHYMDRAEYALARFVNRATPDFSALKDFYRRELLGPDSPEDAAAFVNGILLPLLNARLLVALHKDDPLVPELKQDRLSRSRPSTFVTNPSIPHHGIQPVGFPESIALIPTNRCNNRCRHCAAFRNDSDSYHDVLTLPVIRRLMDEMHYGGLRTLRLTGGEPMLHADFFDILEYAATKYFGIMLYTNGNRIDPSNIARIAAVNDAKEGNFIIHLSLDGGRDSHDWFRRAPGAFDRVLRAMELLRDHEVPFYVEMTCHPMMLNPPEFEDIAAKLHELGSRSLLVHPALQVGRGKQHGDSIGMTFQQVKDMAQRVRRVAEQFPGWTTQFSSYELASSSFEAVSCPKNADENGKQDIGCENTEEKAPAGLPPQDHRPRNGHCTAGKIQLCIAYNGNVYPCPNWVMADAAAMGNIFDNSIAEIWRDSDKWKESRGGWDFGDVAVCKDCPHLKSCNLGRLCRVPSIEWFGTPYGPPPGCITCFRDLGIPETAVRSFLDGVSLADEEANRNFAALLEELNSAPLAALSSVPNDASPAHQK